MVHQLCGCSIVVVGVGWVEWCWIRVNSLWCGAVSAFCESSVYVTETCGFVVRLVGFAVIVVKSIHDRILCYVDRIFVTFHCKVTTWRRHRIIVNRITIILPFIDPNLLRCEMRRCLFTFLHSSWITICISGFEILDTYTLLVVRLNRFMSGISAIIRTCLSLGHCLLWL